MYYTFTSKGPYKLQAPLIIQIQLPNSANQNSDGEGYLCISKYNNLWICVAILKEC